MYFLTFVILAASCATGAVISPSAWLAAILFYAALSFACVSVAYLAKKPLWLLKRPSGKMHPLSWIVYGPFFLLNTLLFHLRRLLSPEKAAHEILPGLHLGRMLTAREAQLLAIPAVVDLVCEFPEPRVLRESPGYRLLPVLDGTSPTLQQLREGSQYIEESLARGGVYIHCAVGHGRARHDGRRAPAPGGSCQDSRTSRGDDPAETEAHRHFALPGQVAASVAGRMTRRRM